MRTQSTRAIIEAAVAERRLLTHPFYVRWSMGQVSLDELRDYASQYRHVETALPRLLTSMAGRCPDREARGRIEETLHDEVGDARRPSHVALFEGFATSLGAATAAPADATVGLLTTLDGLVEEGVVQGLAALAAYEVQSPEVSASKALGLRQRYGMDDDGVAFWDAHAGADVDHAAWTVAALDRLHADGETVARCAQRSAEAWWAFLDEREAAAPVRD